ATPRLQFTLPETKQALDLNAELAWADIKGRAGLRFLNVPESTLEFLEKWLNDQMEKQLPRSNQSSSESIQ
ncbi:MAG: hypothetical protein WCC89_12510, partial [Candidatus Sulfotelmatobacter sp.]